LLSLPAFALTDFHDGAGRARSWLGLAFIPPYILRPLFLLVIVMLAAVFGSERDATVAAVALVASTWMVALIQFALQERRFRREVPVREKVYRHGEWIKVSLPLLLLESFALMMMNIDVLLLKLFVTPTDIGIYFAAARTISFVSFIHFAIVAVAIPRFSTAYARHDIESAAVLLGKFRLWTFLPSLIASVVLLGVGPYVLRLFGPEYPAAWPVMAALAGGHLARALAGPAEALLAVSGRQLYTAVVGGVTAAVNIGLNLALIPKFGLLGAGIATAVSFAFQALVLGLAARRLLREGYHAPVTCAPEPRQGE
jgi:O-antigen/teichoic acid export membrane protein